MTKPRVSRLVPPPVVMRSCEWFATCRAVSVAAVEHPTLGDVEICARHLDWLAQGFSPTKMVPPIVARQLSRHPLAAEALNVLVDPQRLAGAEVRERPVGPCRAPSPLGNAECTVQLGHAGPHSDGRVNVAWANQERR
jgi:hypothetical protein